MLGNLTDDLVVNIALHLNFLDLMKLCRVNHNLSHVCKDRFFWYLYAQQHDIVPKDPNADNYNPDTNYRNVFIDHCFIPVTTEPEHLKPDDINYANDPETNLVFGRNQQFKCSYNARTNRLIYSSPNVQCPDIYNPSVGMVSGPYPIYEYVYGSVVMAPDAKQDWLYTTAFLCKVTKDSSGSATINRLRTYLKQYIDEVVDEIFNVGSIPSDTELQRILGKITLIYNTEVRPQPDDNTYIEPSVDEPDNQIVLDYDPDLKLMIYKIFDIYVFIVIVTNSVNVYTDNSYYIKDIYASTDDFENGLTMLKLINRKFGNVYEPKVLQ